MKIYHHKSRISGEGKFRAKKVNDHDYAKFSVRSVPENVGCVQYLNIDFEKDVVPMDELLNMTPDTIESCCTQCSSSPEL